MNLLKISWENIKSKPLNTFLSLLLLAFGIGLISLLMLVQDQLSSRFERNIKDIDMVLGAKGSPLQLILSAVYQVDAPTGNISLKDAKRVMKNPLIAEAIPLAYGDNYKKYRIVGTTEKYPAHYEAIVKEGRLWKENFEVTIGSKVASESGLKIGDEFYSAHGLDEEGESHEEHAFRVVGVFEENNTVIDNLVLTRIESIWEVHNHEGHATEENTHEGHNHAENEHHDHAETNEEDSREITAVLLKKRSPMAIMTIPNLIRSTNMQVALTAIEVNRLTQNFGVGLKTMTIIGFIVVIISFISVFISLYNSLKERKYELAIMRTLGGSRTALFLMILLEGLVIAIIGFLIGIVLSRLGLLLLSNMMEDNFQFSINNLGWTSGETILLAITLLVGILASFLPAYQAIRLDISKTLSDG